MIRVVVADDHPLVVQGISALFSAQDDMVVVGQCDHGGALMDLLKNTRADVAVTDMSMPGRSGLSLISELHQRYPKLALIVLSVHGEQQYAARALKAGAQGYLSKDRAGQELLDAVRQVARGKLYITPGVAEQLALNYTGQYGHANEPHHEQLSPREYEVFAMLAEGRTVSEIADTLYVSVKTVATHKARIMQKMQFRNIVDLVRYALNEGMFPNQRVS